MHPDVPAALRFGRRRKPLIQLKDVADMIAPTCHVKDKEQLVPIEWDINQQGRRMDPRVTVTDVRNMVRKITDLGPDTRFGAGYNLSDQNDSTFIFNGGKFKYTFMNMSNHDVYMDIFVFKPKKPTNMSIDWCWDRDRDDDNTHADTPGLEITQVPYGDESKDTVGSRPGATGIYMRTQYRKRFIARRLLKPGEEMKYTHVTPGWKWNMRTLAMHLTGNAPVDGDKPDYFEKTELLYFFCHSQLVGDTFDTDTTHGSGAVRGIVQSNYSFRGVPGWKAHQHVFMDKTAPSGEFANESHVNPDTENVVGYNEV